MVYGVPNIIQSDNGREFKKHITKYCRENKIKMIRSRLYNPKGQGNVERAHWEYGKKYNMTCLNKKTWGELGQKLTPICGV